MYTFLEDVFDVTRYPAGETHLKLAKPAGKEALYAAAYGSKLVIECHAYDMNGLLLVKAADTSLKAMGINATFFVPYFPFAREDRRHHRADGQELLIAMEFLQGTNLVIVDPHSEVAGTIPHISQEDAVRCLDNEVGLTRNSPAIVIPDAGAAKKAYEWKPVGQVPIMGYKKRDASSGSLSGFGVHFNSNLNNCPVLIVDDICDGGGTFLGLADVVKAKGAGKLTLAVTHGLFTKGPEALTRDGYFDRLVTFRSPWTDPRRVGSVRGLETVPFQKLWKQAQGNIR